MKTALVTGAAGLLGTHMSRHLLSMGYRVVGVDNLQGGYKDFLPEDKSFSFIKSDLNEFDKIEAIFDEWSPGVVFHFAAYAAEGLSPFIRRFNYENNVLASSTVINNCIKYGSKLVFTSSMAVYGNQPAPFTEGMAPAPVDPYGIAKYAIELDLASAASQFGLRYSIVRPHNVVGIYQNVWDRYRNVLGIFVRKALSNEPIVVYGDGTQTRAFSDISFYMDPLSRLIDEFDGEIFNIGADQEIQILELAKLVQKEAGLRDIEVEIEFAEPRDEVPFAFCDHAKARALLSFHDNTDLETVIREMFDWVATQPTRSIKNMSYELDNNLYSFWK